jgi:hypothetical protein
MEKSETQHNKVNSNSKVKVLDYNLFLKNLWELTHEPDIKQVEN